MGSARVAPRTVTYSNTTTLLTPSTTAISTNTSPFVATQTITVTASEIPYKLEINNNEQTTINLYGPTTITTILTNDFEVPELVDIGPSIQAETIYIYAGGEVLEIASGDTFYETTVTRTGIFVASVTLSVGQHIGNVILPGINSSEPHCQQGATFSQLGHSVTIQRLIAALSDQETLTTYIGTQDPQVFKLGGVTVTVVGLMTEYTTQTLPLDVGFFGPDEARPGIVCGGHCGVCQLYFPEISVLYWPVASQNCVSRSQLRC